MNIRKAVALVAAIVLLLGAGALGAQSTPAQDNPLDQIGWMVGGKWVAQVKSQDGSPLTIETTIRWADNKRSIKFLTVFRSEKETVPRYEGFYGWHPARKSLAFWYFDNRGNFTEGTARADGNQVEQEFEIIQVDGQAQKYRSRILRQGQDAYLWNLYVPKAGEWNEAMSVRYTRQN